MTDENENEIGTDFEKDARAQGWKPQEEWSGDAEKWVDAKTFVTRAQDWVGPLKKEINLLRKTMRQVVETNRRQAEQSDHNFKVRESELQSHIAQLSAQRDAAVAASDASAAVQLERNISAATQELSGVQATSKLAATPAAELVQDAQDFKSRNRTWYGADSLATKDADTVGQIYASMYPEKDLSEVLEYVEAQIFDKYPQYAPKTTRPSGPQSSNSGVRNVGTPSSSSWENLDEETKSVAEMLIKRKVFKNKDDYLKAYEETDKSVDVTKFKKGDTHD